MRRALLALLFVLAACGADDPGTGSDRPSTAARLAIVAPTANEVTGPDVTVTLDLQGAKVVSRTSGELTPDEGHIHLVLDGDTVTMAFKDSLELKDLAPGMHSLRAEFVAVDHQHFANRVVAAVLFEVQP